MLYIQTNSESVLMVSMLGHMIVSFMSVPYRHALCCTISRQHNLSSFQMTAGIKLNAHRQCQFLDDNLSPWLDKAEKRTATYFSTITVLLIQHSTMLADLLINNIECRKDRSMDGDQSRNTSPRNPLALLKRKANDVAWHAIYTQK